MADDKIYDRPSTPRAEYVAVAPDLLLVHDLLEGTRRMHERFKAYIPKYSAEKPLQYKRRGTAAKVYGGLSRTLSAAIGMLFARPPAKLSGWTADVSKHWENIDGKGTKGDVYLKLRSRDAIADGYVGILVDHPAPPEGVQVHAGNEDALNLRPIWAYYARADIISWLTDTIDNVETLSQVVLREGSSEKVGKFGSKPLVRYRVCMLLFGQDPAAAKKDAPSQWIACWQLLEEKTDTSGNVTVVPIGKPGAFRDRAGKPFARIPFAVPYGGHTEGTLCAQPPLLDVAWANLEHWRVATNLRHYEDMCCVPQPTIEGELATDENGREIPFALGPTTLVRTKAGSKFSFVELQGYSIEQLRNSLAEKKDEIAELGMSFLAKKTRGVEAVEAKRLDAIAENATLSTSAQGLTDGYNQALMFHAQYLGVTPEAAPVLAMNTDFDLVAMDATTMLAYVTAVKDAGLPVRTLLEAWQEGGRLPRDTDLDLLEATMEANQAAAQEMLRQELEKQKSQTPPPAKP